MAVIQFQTGDVFTFSQGAGIVLPSGQAFMVLGHGGRTGYTKNIGNVPSDALPSQAKNHEVRFALESVLLVIQNLK